MKTLYTLLLLSLSVLAFGQNENPYSVFGYDAPIMPETFNSVEWNRVNEFRVINTDTSSSVRVVKIDVPNRRVLFYDRNGLILSQDTLEVYTVARWLSVDPKNQFASPYLAMGNNPVMYVDPDGQWVHIVIGAVVGGVVNLATNWKNIDNVWEGLAAFGTGAAVGGATAACGGCGGALAIALGGGALMGATNNIIGQTGNGVGLNQVNWGSVGMSSVVGGISGVAGYGAGSWASNNLASPLINSMSVQSPVLAGMINGTISGAVGGYAGGFTGGLLFTGDIAAANQYGISGLKLGASIGGGVGAASSYVSATRQGINPWTGEFDRGRMGFIGDQLNWRSQMQKHGGQGQSRFENLDDAFKVMDAFNRGDVQMLNTIPGQNRVYFRYNGVRGINVNSNLPLGWEYTNTFFIKGGMNSGTTIVPHSSNYTPPPVKINWWWR
jgi:hypothetical protein